MDGFKTWKRFYFSMEYSVQFSQVEVISFYKRLLEMALKSINEIHFCTYILKKTIYLHHINSVLWRFFFHSQLRIIGKSIEVKKNTKITRGSYIFFVPGQWNIAILKLTLFSLAMSLIWMILTISCSVCNMPTTNCQSILSRWFLSFPSNFRKNIKAIHFLLFFLK